MKVGDNGMHRSESAAERVNTQTRTSLVRLGENTADPARALACGGRHCSLVMRSGGRGPEAPFSEMAAGRESGYANALTAVASLVLVRGPLKDSATRR